MKPTRRQKGAALLSTLQLDPSDRAPLYRQLESKIRLLILDGSLSQHTRLPSSRQLALDLGVSRLTVKNVYEQLLSEGFLETRRGSGTYVARFLKSELPPPDPALTSSQTHVPLLISDRLSAIARSKSTTRLGGVHAFRPGVPALDHFPRRAWAAAYSRAMRSCANDLLGYGPTGGLPDLKRAITAHVRDHRGIRCKEEQIIITAGAQQAFTLLATALLKQGDVVWCEDPGHIAIRDAMRLLGADVRSVPIDQDGFDLAYAADRHRTSRLIFVTPSHQHPLGTTMSLGRRLELLDYARQHGSWIVEDDYDSEFRYSDRALPALHALDHNGQALYVGSFSKSLFPGLRLGYLICPLAIASSLAAAQTLLSQHVSLIQQSVLAQFILDGGFNAHIRKMKLLYRKRRDLLIDQLTKVAADVLILEPCNAGMHLIGWLKNNKISDRLAAETIWQRDVDCLPVSIYCDQQVLKPGIMFGFACASEDEIENGTAEVANSLRTLDNTVD